MTRIKVLRRYATQEECIRYLEHRRWGKLNPSCPFCKAVRPSKHKRRDGRYDCLKCKQAFNVLHGTIFYKSKIPLSFWFLAIRVISNAKKGISSHELARICETTPPTAWYMQMRIRRAMMTEQHNFLAGLVEMDECYVGGRIRKDNRQTKPMHMPEGQYEAHRAKRRQQAVVIGAVQRQGRVKAQTAPNTTLSTIKAFIDKNIATSGTTLITDEHKAYAAAKGSMPHQVIQHKERFVKGTVHTNTIENFWSIFKRSVHGIYYHLSKKHLDAYLIEFAYRYNRRKKSRDALFYETLNRMIDVWAEAPSSGL